MDPIQHMQQVIQNHEAQIQALSKELTDLRTKPARKPKPSLPDPDKFFGTYHWDTWFPAIQAKLRIDSQAIGAPEAQFFYVYGRLDSKVQALVTPQLAVAEDTKQYDPQNLLNQLARLFDDPNKVRDAEDKLQALKQADDDPLPVFLARFERLLYAAKANTWPDNTKIAMLRRGLNKSARSRLDAQVIVPDDYNGFVAMLQKLNIRYHGSGNPKPFNANHNKGEPMDLNTVDIAAMDMPKYNMVPELRSMKKALEEDSGDDDGDLYD